MQKIYALLKNENVIKKATLIVIETNINEIQAFTRYGLSFKSLQRNFELLCKILANLNKPILFILLPAPVCECEYKKTKIINNFNLLQIKQYGFNFINMQEYYDKHHLNIFYQTMDWEHPIAPLMKTLGKNIALNLNIFKNQGIQDKQQLPNLCIATPQELFENINELEKGEKGNSLFKETIYKLNQKTKLKFKKEFEGYLLLSYSVWNETFANRKLGNKLIFKNKNIKIVQIHNTNFLSMRTLNNDFFIIDKESFLCLSKFDQNNKDIQLTDQILLVKPDENFYPKTEYDLEELANLTIEIDEQYNFSHLIPDAVLFKEIIEAYNARMDPIKIAPFKKEIERLKLELNQIKQNPIQTHLAHKLGRAIIENCRSFSGFFSLPFILNYIAKKHKKEANVLPCAENEKQILSYQLGLALIKAHKTWYKGGYMWFIFKALSLKKKFGR